MEVEALDIYLHSLPCHSSVLNWAALKILIASPETRRHLAPASSRLRSAHQIYDHREETPSTTNNFQKLKLCETYRKDSIARLLSSLHSAAKGCPMPRPWDHRRPGAPGPWAARPCGAAVLYSVAWSRGRSAETARFVAARLESQGIWGDRFDSII